MAWVKLDDGFFRHHKAVQAGRDARDLALASWCFSSASLSDGFIPEAALRQLAADAGVGQPKKLAERLVDVGLWEHTQGGYRIHDYLDFNPSRERVLATRQARADAASKGRAKSQQNGSNAPANGEQIAAHRDTVPSHDPSRPLGASSPPERLTEETDSEEGRTPAPPAARERSSGSIKVDYQAEFDEWWRVWPRKEDRKKALISYVKRRKAGRPAEALLSAAERVREYFRVAKPPLDKLPFATTFLNGDRDEEWEHGIPEPRQAEMRRVNPRATPHDKDDRKWENFSWREEGDVPPEPQSDDQIVDVAEPRPYLPHPVPT